VGLFDAPWKKLSDFFAALADVRELRTDDQAEWPVGSELVLAENTAVELGNPAVGSLFLLLWSDRLPVADGRLFLQGGELAAGGPADRPFGAVLRVAVTEADDYEISKDLRDTVFGMRLRGFTMRSLPSRQTMWCRISKKAMAEGFSLAMLGATWLRRLRELPFVRGAELHFFGGDAAPIRALRPLTEECAAITAALYKMNEEHDFDCTRCDYREICDRIVELQALRRKIRPEREEP